MTFSASFSSNTFPPQTQCLKIAPKSRIQVCEQSELRLHFEWKKFIKNAKNSPFWRVLENLKLPV